ncbi:MAG: DUF362 domain-containing protein [Deltaproteobacteria bacterium]|nr:DUF362 domain-containing protein [Deltaproteobacteria bacterium]
MNREYFEKIDRYIESRFSRRSFLKYQMKGLLFLAAGGSGLLLPKKIIAEPLPDIAVAKGETARAVRAAVELLGGIKKFVGAGAKVLIKPNMSFPNTPAMATTTNPDVVTEIVKMCNEAGASNILVVDYPLFDTDTCLQRSGIPEAIAKLENTRVVGASSDRLYKDTEIKDAKKMSRNGIFQDALKIDTLISVPVAKSHTATGVSLSMKGMMGLVWDRSGMHTKELSSSIVDLCTVLKAHLTVIDATRVLTTNGPRGPGKVLKEDTIIASKDMVAADAFTVARFPWYGKRYKPAQVQYIREAHERGLGRMDIESLSVKEIQV